MSFAEREETAVLNAQDRGVREIARRLSCGALLRRVAGG
jgi:hypothetical protein